MPLTRQWSCYIIRQGLVADIHHYGPFPLQSQPGRLAYCRPDLGVVTPFADSLETVRQSPMSSEVFT